MKIENIENIQNIPNSIVEDAIANTFVSALSKDVVVQDSSGFQYIEEELDSFAAQVQLLNEISQRSSAIVNKLDIRNLYPQFVGSPLPSDLSTDDFEIPDNPDVVDEEPEELQPPEEDEDREDI